MKELLKRNQNFVNEMVNEETTYFEQFSHGQKPKYFVLCCSDSRVNPVVTFKGELGEFFIQRNVGNQVVESDESFTAALYYALTVLNIKEIIIIGHTNCGAINAACHGNLPEELDPWVSQIQQGFSDEKEGKLDVDEIAKQNVLFQVEKLKSHPIFKKYGRDSKVNGLMYDVGSGVVSTV
jgi:carbonic anhydrase